MKKWRRVTLCVMVGMFLPMLSNAQGLTDNIKGMQQVLEQLYNEMMPMCSQLIGVGQGIAGFAALWYISSRVWRHLSNAEPIDFYPLFRPFVLGFCIMFFPFVIAMINGVMQPTVAGTAKMVEGSDKAIETLLKQREEAIKNTDKWKMYVGEDDNGDYDRWYKYTHDGQSAPVLENPISSVGNDIAFAMSKAGYRFSNSIKAFMSEVLSILFQAASLCINTLRTFQLIVLAILGPIVFGLAVFDGFQHTLTAWLAKYINIFLWLPVANIFGAIIGKIQEQMIQLDISQLDTKGDTVFSSTDVAYLIFMLIGIVGYFTVPSVAGYIVNAGGGSALGQKVTSMMSSTASSAATRAGNTAGAIGNLGKSFNEGYSGTNKGSGVAASVGSAIGTSGAYLADKIAGNSK